jgi:hypothetical protein
MILSNELFSSIIFFGRSSIDRGNVSLSVWVLWRLTQALHLRAGNGHQISKADLGFIAR